MPMNQTELQGFIGLAVVFHVIIENFQLIIAPLYSPLWKDVQFFWRSKQDVDFYNIKKILSIFPCVLPLDYTVIPLIIILAVDASLKGWGAVLMQVHWGKQHPAQYKSGI